MGEEAWGIVLAAQRARKWLPKLANDGERMVLNAMVLYTGQDGTASPNAQDIAELVDRSTQSVRRILRTLSADEGPLAKVGKRPVYSTADDRYKGGFVHVYALRPGDHPDDQLAIRFPGEHPDDQVGDSQVITEGVPGDHPDDRQPRTQVSAIESLNLLKDDEPSPPDHPDDQVGGLGRLEHPTDCDGGFHSFRIIGPKGYCRYCSLSVVGELAQMGAAS